MSVGGFGVSSDIDPGVDVGSAPEMPDERRTFQTPDIPDTVLAKRILLIEGKVDFVQTTVCGDLFHNLFRIRWAIRRQQVMHYRLYQLSLVFGEFSNCNAGECPAWTLQCNLALSRGFFDERNVPLLAVESMEHLVGALSLHP